MPPSKPSKPSHQPLIEGDAEKPAALRRAQNGAANLISRHVKPRVEEAMTTVAPLVEKGAHAAIRKLAEPARARLLQKSMAGLAQWTMATGLELDPHAGPLFEFVDTLEQYHSREGVLKIIARHASSYERDMLQLMMRATQNTGHSGLASFADGDLPDFLKEFMGLNTSTKTPNSDAGSAQDASQFAEEFERQRERLGDSMLDLLCELAALESDELPPHTPDAQRAYFADAPIEPRFKLLAKLAAGDPEAFAAVAQQSTEQSAKEAPGAADTPGAEGGLRAKISGSRLGRLLRRDSTGFTESAEAETTSDTPSETRPTPPSGMLARFVPSLNDPATRFLTTSHLFFLQSYLMRTTIEGLPQMLATVAEIEREVERNKEDVMVINPPEPPSK